MKLKTKSNLLIGIFTLAMILGVFALAIGTARGSYSQVVIVEPSGGDDTDAIQDAFGVVGQGGTVQLIAGDYYIDNIILEDFCGRFKGAGMGLTTIYVHDEVTPDPINDITALFKFDGGDIQISDLSFDILPEPYLDNIMWLTGAINSKLTRVKFTGHEGTYTDPVDPQGMSWNVYAAIAINGIPDGYTTGKHSIKKCEFESVAIGIETFSLVNSKLNVGEGYSTGNTFKGGSYGVRMWNTVNSKIKISHNYIEAHVRAGIYVTQAFLPEYWLPSWPIISSQWVITHNFVYTYSVADGIILYDWYVDVGEEDAWDPSIEALISHNHITLDNDEWGGLVLIGVDDAFIIKNVVTGLGDYGFDLWFCNNLKILGNRIQIDALGTSPGNSWGLFYGMSLWYGFDNVLAINTISHKKTDGLFIIGSNENLILGNLIKDNGGFGLNLVSSNYNRIIVNVFCNNYLGNIEDDSTTNIYLKNWEY
ncbi:MAG: NosD domain-containing protein [Candidatus Thorarchaeota archaeon]